LVEAESNTATGLPAASASTLHTKANDTKDAVTLVNPDRVTRWAPDAGVSFPRAMARQGKGDGGRGDPEQAAEEAAMAYPRLVGRSEEARFLLVGPEVTSNAAGGKPDWSYISAP
jgi:hypothetical protein